MIGSLAEPLCSVRSLALARPTAAPSCGSKPSIALSQQTAQLSGDICAHLRDTTRHTPQAGGNFMRRQLIAVEHQHNGTFASRQMAKRAARFLGCKHSAVCIFAVACEDIFQRQSIPIRNQVAEGRAIAINTSRRNFSY